MKPYEELTRREKLAWLRDMIGHLSDRTILHKLLQLLEEESAA